MKEGELLFIEATANTEQIFMRERIEDVIYNDVPIELLTGAVMHYRTLFRKKLLKAENNDEREKAIEEFNKQLHDFEVAYLKGLMAMSGFGGYSGIKAVPFLSWYTRYSKMLEIITTPISDFATNTLRFRFGRPNVTFDVQKRILSGWDVFIYRLPSKPDSSWDLVEIDDSTVIEETDWDGTKTKKGIEIIRRNGECGGKVFVFVYMEDVNNEEGTAREKMFHFYSVSIDGKEMRHYQTKQSF